jgi:hypothetical protein
MGGLYKAAFAFFQLILQLFCLSSSVWSRSKPSSSAQKMREQQLANPQIHLAQTVPKKENERIQTLCLPAFVRFPAKRMPSLFCGNGGDRPPRR